MKLKRLIIALFAALLMVGAAVPLSASAVEGTYEFSEEYKSSIFYKRLTEYTLTGDNRYDLLSIAFTQLGYHEGNSDSDMHGYSDGGKNFVEYNRMRQPLDNGEGNGVSYGYAWCASFVTWCLRQANIPHQVAGSEIGCDSMVSWYKRAANYYPSNEDYIPIPGDIIMFGSKKDDGGIDAQHVGIVIGVNGDRVYTIEGNNGGEVATHDYALDSSWVIGYCVANYTVVEGTDCSGFINKGMDMTGEYVITEDGLNVRAKADVNSDAVGTLNAGDKIEVLESDGKWGKIDCNGTEGWIRLSYAKKADRYICSLDFNLQRGDWKTVWNLYGETVIIPEEKPTKDGKMFLGWTTEKNGKEIAYMPGDEYVLTGDATLFAVWQSKYKVEFYDEDDTLLYTTYCEHGEKPTLPEDPTKEGREFTGWTPEPDRPIVSDFKFYATYSGGEDEALGDVNVKENISTTELIIIIASAVVVIIAAVVIIAVMKKKKNKKAID